MIKIRVVLPFENHFEIHIIHMGTTAPLWTHVSFTDIVWVFVDVSRQAEVTDLHHLIVSQQNVPGSQVSVDTLMEAHRKCKRSQQWNRCGGADTRRWTDLARRQELHPTCHLKAERNKILQEQRGAGRGFWIWTYKMKLVFNHVKTMEKSPQS